MASAGVTRTERNCVGIVPTVFCQAAQDFAAGNSWSEKAVRGPGYHITTLITPLLSAAVRTTAHQGNAAKRRRTSESSRPISAIQN